jgi:hypothetical protein
MSMFTKAADYGDAPDFFISGISPVSSIEGGVLVRVTFYAAQDGTEADPIENRVVVKQLWTLAALREALQMLAVACEQIRRPNSFGRAERPPSCSEAASEAPSVMPAGLLLLWNGECSEALRFFPGGSIAEFDIEAFISQLAGLVSPRSACPQCAGRRAVIPALTAALLTRDRHYRGRVVRGRPGQEVAEGQSASGRRRRRRSRMAASIALISSSNCWAFAFAAVCSACVPEEKAAARHLYCFCCFAVIAARSDLPLSHPRS